MTVQSGKLTLNDDAIGHIPRSEGRTALTIYIPTGVIGYELTRSEDPNELRLPSPGWITYNRQEGRDPEIRRFYRGVAGFDISYIEEWV